MGTGGGIFLILIGAILSFAVDTSAISGVNLVVVGYICMIVGALALAVSLSQMRTGNRSEIREIVERRDVPPPPRP